MNKDLEATLKRRASGELRLDVKGLRKTQLETSVPPVEEQQASYEPEPTVKHPSINPPPRTSTVFVDPESRLSWDDWEEETA